MKIEKYQSVKDCDTGEIEKVYVYVKTGKDTLTGYPIKASSIEEAKKLAPIKYPEIFKN
jgi:hypothetical protein